MLPQRTKAEIDRFVYEGIMPGRFVYSVLCNDLKMSFGYADEENRAAMYEIVKYIYNKIPMQSQGSPERVAKWLVFIQEERAKQTKEDKNVL